MTHVAEYPASVNVKKGEDRRQNHDEDAVRERHPLNQWSMTWTHDIVTLVPKVDVHGENTTDQLRISGRCLPNACQILRPHLPEEDSAKSSIFVPVTSW